MEVNPDSERNNKLSNTMIDQVRKTNESEYIIEGGILKKYLGNSSVLKISEKVKVIGKGVFQSNRFLKTVYLPSSVRVIENDAFADCMNLEYIYLNDGLEKIGDRAFNNCKFIRHCKIPDTVTHLGEYVFWGCIRLLTVKLSNGMTEIKGGTFFECEFLEQVELPYYLRKICKYAFKGSGIRELKLPRSLAIVEENSFYACNRLKQVTVTSNICLKNDVFGRDINLPKIVYL